MHRLLLTTLFFSLLTTLSIASPLNVKDTTAALVERQATGGQLLAVENGWVVDMSWLNQVPPSQRQTINIPGVVANGDLINPAPPGSKAGTQVGSTGGSSNSSSTGNMTIPLASSTAARSFVNGTAGNSPSKAPCTKGPTSTSLPPTNPPNTGVSVPPPPPANTSIPNPPPNVSSAIPPPTTTTGSTSNSTATDTSTSGGAGGCPANMKGVTFNGGFNPGMFDTIGAATDWLTFGLNGANGASPHAQAGYIPMMAFASDVPAAVTLVTGPNPPAWLLTFNEPDYSYGGVTPTMSPQEAASAIQPLLNAKLSGGTKFVAPVTADSTSSWLDDFYTACNCKSFFSAYNIHIYTPSSSTVQQILTTFHGKYSDKPLWLTEVAPGGANPPCSLGWNAVTAFMNDVYKFAAGSGWIDRVFWNTGNQIGGGDQNVCNSYLLDGGGNASPLLQSYKDVNCQ